jgi:hypothetical protein
LSRVQVPVVTLAGSAMVVLLVSVGASDGHAVEASLVEVSTNCCIQYKHAFASFIPPGGNIS